MNHVRTHRSVTLLTRLLTLLMLSGLIVACSSSASDPQPTASFEGSYKGKMTSTTQVGNQTYTQTVNALTVQIKPGSKTNTVTVQLFDDTFGEISDPLIATVQGNTLTLARQTTPGYPDDEYQGSGSLSGKTLSLTLNDTDNGTTEVQTITATKP